MDAFRFIVTKYGTARMQNAIFLPRSFMMTRNIKVPKKPPRYDIDPNHDACTVFIEPLLIGGCGDRRSSSEGDSQPIRFPYEMAHMLAVKKD